LYNIQKAEEYNNAKNVDYLTGIKNYLCAYYTAKTEEVVLLVSYNSRMKKISEDVIGEGNVNSAEVSIGKILKIVIENKASSVVLAHNHPNGTLEPSIDDIMLTRKLINILKEINVYFIEHYIVAGQRINGIKNRTIVMG